MAKSFSALQRRYVPERDYAVAYLDRSSDAVIMAPHGGGIEPGTSVIAKTIAREDLSLYLFEGLMSSGNRRLHITSHRFEEPTALAALRLASWVVTVHGYRSARRGVLVGGLDGELVSLIRQSLEASHFRVERARRGLEAVHPRNIANRGKLGRGVQLEISRGLRQALKRDPSRLVEFGDSVRAALDTVRQASIAE